MKETSGQYTIEPGGRVKNNKELIWILVIVIFLALSFFLPKGIIGYVSFSIYPEEPAGSDISNTNESFGIVPIEEISVEKEKEEGFGILPVENLSVQLENISGFEIKPNENFVKKDFGIMGWINQSDGFSTSAFGSSNPSSITTNGSDFWIVDTPVDKFVYHVNKSGYNFTDGFSTTTFGSIYPWGITTNGSDFWIADLNVDFVYHTDRLGNNMGDGFSTVTFGSNGPSGITTNDSDFWIVDFWDDFVYHVNKSGYNFTDGFSIYAIGSETSYGITTNDSDFWITDEDDQFVYHTDRLGNNITDGFSTSAFGSNGPDGIITNAANSTPTDFWVGDIVDKFVYHVKFNNPPTITPIYIYSDDNTKNTTIVNLTGTFSITDIENDLMILNETRWYNNSIEEIGMRNQTNVSYLNTTTAERWMFSARTYDGTDWSDWYTSSNFTILNTAPIISLTYIVSDADARNDTNVNLTGTFTYTDEDNDLTIMNETRWYNNSIEVTSLRNFTLVLAGNTTKLENWTFGARTFDGTNWSIWTNSSNFTILSAAPIVYLRTPANESSSTTQATTFTYNVTDIDGDEISNCTLWIESPSLGLINGGTNTSDITIDTDETLTYTLNYETINWSVGCTDISNAKTNSSKFVYTVNQPPSEPAEGVPSNPEPIKIPPVTPPITPPVTPPITPPVIPPIIKITQDISNIFGDLHFPWEGIPFVKANITSKYKCNGIEFNINDSLLFSFNFYNNKPRYVIDLDYNPNKEKYCPWCYNKIQDYDEIGVDCGGSCPPCVEKPLETWKCGKIPLFLIILIAMLLASLIYGYYKSKYKYEFRIGVSVTTIALVSSIICKYLGICYYKYLAFLYCLGIIAAIYIIVYEIILLKKIKISKEEYKLPEKIVKKEVVDVENIINNSIIEFNTLAKKIKLYIHKGKYGKAYQDYNAANEIYEYLIDKASGEQLAELYNILEELYHKLFVQYINNRLNIKLKGLKKEYKFNLELPKIREKRTKEKLIREEKELSKVHRLIEENKLDEAVELYKKYYSFYLPKIDIKLDLEKVGFSKLKELPEIKFKEELTSEEKKLNKLHKLIKENKIGLPRHISHLKEESKPEFVDKFDSELDELIDLIRKGKYKDAEGKYKKLFGN